MGNTCLRRARDIKFLIDSKNLNLEAIQTDEEMQKFMSEIILEELNKNDPDSEFAKEIFEFQNSKIASLKRNNDIKQVYDEEKIFVNTMMIDIMSKVLKNQN